MSERLSDVEIRIHTAHQLAAVIAAMRGIAAMRSREAHQYLDGIRAYAKTIGTGIGDALTFMPAGGGDRQRSSLPGTHAIVALCAEQGFAGAFSEHVLDAAAEIAKQTRPRQSRLLLVGSRGLLIADERGLDVAWSMPMISHPDQAAKLANQIVEVLYQSIDDAPIVAVTLVHAQPGVAMGAAAVAQKQLVPFDFSRFPRPTTGIAPLITLAPQVLLTRLAEEYVFAEFCEAVILSFAAENEARMRAMIAAHNNVNKTLNGLVARSRQLRQEEITNEIVELAAGTMTTLST
jgi:F-type H+-transporting ATPase subunit gamma